MDFVPEISALDVSQQIEVDADTADMLKHLELHFNNVQVVQVSRDGDRRRPRRDHGDR